MTAFDGIFSPLPPSRPVLSGRFETPAEKKRLPRLRVYVDETGDRNFGKSSPSDWFTMTAVLVPEEEDKELRFIVGGLKYTYGLRPDAMLHWRDHFRLRHEGRRQYAAEKLAGVAGLIVIHVLLHKPSVMSDAYMRSAQDNAYNFVTKLLLERVANTAAEWPGGERLALVRLGVVGGVDHEVTAQYMHHVATHPRPNERAIPWGNLSWPMRWSQSKEFDGLQVADIYAGMLRAAVHGDPAAPLLRCAHQHRRAPFGRRPMYGYGVKVHPAGGAAVLNRMPWWPTLLA